MTLPPQRSALILKASNSLYVELSISYLYKKKPQPVSQLISSKPCNGFCTYLVNGLCSYQGMELSH